MIIDPLIVDSIAQCNNHRIDSNIKILKLDTRRCILLVDTNQGPLVVKSFPFTRIKEKLKYKKYGLAEINNNAKARQLGIKTPEYYAYFESRRFGLVSINGCIMSFLTAHTSLEELCKNSADQLDLAIPVLTELFHTGVNHIDLSPANIFFTQDNTNYSIIDWQYCSFHTPNDPLQLAVQTAHFLRGITADAPLGWQSQWLDKLYIASNIDISKRRFMAAISTLQGTKLSIKKRLELDFDRITLFGT